jgi:polyisoprenoid-binding protein YceI
MFIFVKKIKHMKAFNLLFVAAAAISLVSCGGSEEPTAEKVTYQLDTKASTLAWTGSKNPSYFHIGSVNFSSGSVEMEGDKLVGGTFTVDMNSIDSKDPNVPADKLPMLVGHLKDTAFFFVADFPEVTVTVGEYANGKLPTTITVKGMDIKQDIAVKVVSTESNVKITGKFDVDFSALKMMGMEPQPGSPEHVLPIINFDLNLSLDKK